MKIHGINSNGETIVYEMDELYAENTGDGVVLNKPTTNKKKKKKKNNGEGKTKTDEDEQEENGVATEGGAGSGNFAPVTSS